MYYKIGRTEGARGVRRRRIIEEGRRRRSAGRWMVGGGDGVTKEETQRHGFFTRLSRKYFFF